MAFNYRKVEGLKGFRSSGLGFQRHLGAGGHRGGLAKGKCLDYRAGCGYGGTGPCWGLLPVERWFSDKFCNEDHATVTLLLSQPVSLSQLKLHSCLRTTWRHLQTPTG